MTETVLLVIPGLGTLRMKSEEFNAALTTQSNPEAPAPEPLVDAETLATLLNLPQSWIEQRTREEQLPCYRAGRWIRYRRSEVEACLRTQGKRP